MFVGHSITYRSSIEKMLEAIDLSALRGKSILITGATGMIGSCLVDALMQWNHRQENPCQVIAAGRNAAKAQHRFASVWNKPCFSFWAFDINEPLAGDAPGKVDYIVHAASNADPINFAKYPVDTLLANVNGTHTLLQYGKSHGMKRFLYVSSGEMYGQPNANYDDFVEDYSGPIDHSSARACYPTGKRAGEVLCQAYASQYGTDVVIVRPCHVFGPTMTKTDSRASSEFLRSAVEGKDIILKSAGAVERSHCYVVDAVQGILLVMTEGKSGEAYNIADEAYKMRIRDFAQKAAQAGGGCVRFESPSDAEAKGYSKVGRSVLSASKLIALGWRTPGNARDAIQETVQIIRETFQERGFDKER